MQQLPDNNPIIVLEAGATHNGNIKQVMEMIDAACCRDFRVSAIKFQTVWAGNLANHRTGSLTYRDFNGEHRRPILDMLRERELAWHDWVMIDQYCSEVGLPWFSTPDTPATAKTLGNCQGPSPSHQFHCCGIKVAGADMGRTDLIAAAANTGLRVLLDTRGGKDELDAALEIVKMALDIFDPIDREYYDELPIIVHTPTGYPTTDPNLNRITELKADYPEYVIGFTSHSPGITDCVKAVLAGARYIEKGITLDRKQPGIEHLMCLEPQEIQEFVDTITEASGGVEV